MLFICAATLHYVLHINLKIFLIQCFKLDKSIGDLLRYFLIKKLMDAYQSSFRGLNVVFLSVFKNFGKFIIFIISLILEYYITIKKELRAYSSFYDIIDAIVVLKNFINKTHQNLAIFILPA